MAAVPGLCVSKRNDICFENANFRVSVLTNPNHLRVAGSVAVGCGPSTKLEVAGFGVLELQHLSHTFCTMNAPVAANAVLKASGKPISAGDSCHMDYGVARFVFQRTKHNSVLRVRMPGARACWTEAHRERDGAFAVHFAAGVYLDLCGGSGSTSGEPPWMVHVHLNLHPYAFLRYVDRAPHCQVQSSGRFRAAPMAVSSHKGPSLQQTTVRGFAFKTYAKSNDDLFLKYETSDPSNMRMMALCLACVKPFADDCCMSRAARDTQEDRLFMLNLAGGEEAKIEAREAIEALRVKGVAVDAPSPDISCYGRMAMYIDMRYQLCAMPRGRCYLQTKSKGMHQQAVLGKIAANLALCEREPVAADVDMQTLYTNLVADLCSSMPVSSTTAATLSQLFGTTHHLVKLQVNLVEPRIHSAVMSACRVAWNVAVDMPAIVAVDARGMAPFTTVYSDDDLDFRPNGGLVYTLCCVVQYNTEVQDIRRSKRNRKSDCTVYYRALGRAWRRMDGGPDYADVVLQHTPRKPAASGKPPSAKNVRVGDLSDSADDVEYMLDDEHRRVQMLFYARHLDASAFRRVVC